MKRASLFFQKGSSKGGDDKKANDDGAKPAPKGGQDSNRNKAKGNRDYQSTPRETQKPKSAPGVQKQPNKTARNAQSALRPGNTSGVVKQKEHPLVQFGPVLKEFLASNELVNKRIVVKYDHQQEKMDVAVSFKKVLENGVSTSASIDMPIDQYLAERKNLLKVKDESSHYIGFVTRCLERIGVDLSAAKPSVAYRAVEAFVTKHLSPIERGLIQLSNDEYDRVDTTKVPEIMAPALAVIKDYYGSVQERTEYLVKTINTDGPVVDKPPPNWVLHGVSGLSKGVLLDTLKIQHAPRLNEGQKEVLEALRQSLFGSDESTSEDASAFEAEKKQEDVKLL